MAGAIDTILGAMEMIRSVLFGVLVALAIVGVGSMPTYADTTDTAVYGGGSYGNCDFGACSLTLSSGGTTNINVVPTPTGACTVQSDTISVLTNNSAGYSVTATTSTTNNAMTGASGAITASGGSSAVPAALTSNTWGYRVDNLSGFGAGPTSAQSNGSVPSVFFAAIPPSNQAGTVIASSSIAANPAVQTTVWYGVCANTTTASGAYAVSVTYTAVTN